jgi:hypothetical protein
MRLQSIFMLITVQSFFFASQYITWVKVLTLVADSSCGECERDRQKTYEGEFGMSSIFRAW